MKSFNYRKLTINVLWLFFACATLYGMSRLYYQSTGGFSIQNISSDYSYNPAWETNSLKDSEKEYVDSILSQKFVYLGKGCQSYVFTSGDGDYVIKFFKYQRFRTAKWVEFFTFIPWVDDYYLKKVQKKRVKLEGVFSSWCIAFDHLSDETGVVYVHLNKTDHLQKSVSIIDKAGYEHKIWIDDFEFMIQKRAKMLCDEIDELMAEGGIDQAQKMLVSLVDTILDEYHRGYADNDHALMQNTGIIEGKPVHIDVGQFVSEEIVKNPNFHMQELYTKTYKFRIWLRDTYPELCDRFEEYLQDVIGNDFVEMKPLWRDRIEIFQ
ncbi:MAG: hypothetical protein AAGG81_03450 [Chlamydiota bacterium]